MGRRKSKLRLVASNEPVKSDAHPMRVLRSGSHFEEGNDRNAKIITFRDYPLAILHRTGRLDPDRIAAKKLFDAGEEHHEVWHKSGLSGRLLKAIERWHPEFVPSWSDGVGHEPGMPADDTEAFWRARYRDRVQKMGLLISNTVEWVVCWRTPVELLARQEVGYRTGQAVSCEETVLWKLKKGLKVLAGLDK